MKKTAGAAGAIRHTEAWKELISAAVEAEAAAEAYEEDAGREGPSVELAGALRKTAAGAREAAKRLEEEGLARSTGTGHRMSGMEEEARDRFIDVSVAYRRLWRKLDGLGTDRIMAQQALMISVMADGCARDIEEGRPLAQDWKSLKFTWECMENSAAAGMVTLTKRRTEEILRRALGEG